MNVTTQLGALGVTEDRHPWLLARLVEKIQPLIRREGALMLEKK